MTRVVAAIIERRDRLLICQRPSGQAFAGQWEFPGGKMRLSETPQAALQRELREELAIEARIGAAVHRVRHRYPGMPRDVEITFFRAQLKFGTPRNIVFKQIRWVRYGDLPAYDFLAADRFLVTQLSRGFWQSR